MTTSLEQSVKERLRLLARERNTSFAELWRNLILERFLARLCRSQYKDRFILKGGTLLARYITLGRETKDLDFLVQKLSNAKESLSANMDAICAIDLMTVFPFKKNFSKPPIHAIVKHKIVPTSKSATLSQCRNPNMRVKM